MTALAAAPVTMPTERRGSVRFVPPDASGVAAVVIDRPDDAVNAIDPQLIFDLGAALADARAARPRGLVIESAKADQFVGGADLSLVENASPADLERASRAVQEVFDAVAAFPCTVVAAINGSCLGGGYELALACDRRVAADSPAVRIGLPEVTIGLVPAAGGTQRLPRLVGLPRALDLILAGRRLTARRAKRAGLVDDVVHPAVLARAAREDALRHGKARPRGGATAVERAATWLAPARAYALRTARERVEKETKGHYPAPFRALEAIATGLAQGTAAGLAVEARAFAELASSATARELIRLLVLTLRQRKAAQEGLGTPREVRHVGVIGLGFMGSGIAQAAAAADKTVRGRDRDAAAVAKGIAAVRRLTTDAAKKGVFDRREAARIAGRVTGGSDLAGFRHADLVIEAVFEDLATKRRVVAELEQVVRDDAVIATNTSALPIREIAAEARRPERIVGMHFFSPVHKMPLVEVVRPEGADPDAVATVVRTAVEMGKTVIVVGDGPGFYTTRVITTLIGEAFRLVQDGVAIDAIDRAMTDFGWPVGPLKLADEVGLEVGAHAAGTVAKARGLEVPPILGQLIAQGYKGKGRGGGFYLYEGKEQRPNPRVYEMAGVTAPSGGSGIAEKLTEAFVREAQRCLDEGVLRSAEEGDLGAIMGLGFPPFLGGPFRYARAKGIR
jgi:3-hydroxyacyl-CoA dehydrogenase / enoyl-CoA hydratase / 3-hydroxybutyryl-CoA epimerase